MFYNSIKHININHKIDKDNDKSIKISRKRRRRTNKGWKIQLGNGLILLNMDVTLEEYSITKHSKKGAARYSIHIIHIHINCIYVQNIHQSIHLHILYLNFFIYLEGNRALTQFTRHIKKL